MKPSDSPLSPFSPNYKAKIDWGKQQKSAQAKEAVSKYIEKKRMENPDFDKTIGMVYSDKVTEKLLPKKFHVFAKAGAPKK